MSDEFFMNLSVPRVPPLLPVLSGLMPLAFGLLGLAMGKEAGWDLQNYHWYNTYAWLNQRLHFDLAVGHHATYYNPLIDVPLYLLANRLSALGYGFLLAALQGLNFVLLLWLAWYLLRIESPRARAGWAAAIALAGMLGGGAITELGGNSHDNLVSLPILASLLLLTSRSDRLVQLVQLEQARGWAWLPVAGALLGAAMGLKLTAGIFTLGFVSAALLLALSLWLQDYLLLFMAVWCLIGTLHDYGHQEPGYDPVLGTDPRIHGGGRPGPGLWERFRASRAAKAEARAEKQAAADAEILDRLLAKVSAQGLPSLTDQERKQLHEISRRQQQG